MKKYVFCLGILLIALIFVSIPYSYGASDSLNSNDLYEYINSNHIQNVKKICTIDFCDYLRSVRLEESIEIFKSKYQDFLTTKIGKDRAYEVILKGFPITKIECF